MWEFDENIKEWELYFFSAFLGLLGFLGGWAFSLEIGLVVGFVVFLVCITMGKRFVVRVLEVIHKIHWFG